MNPQDETSAMKPENEVLALNLDCYMELIDNIDEVVLSDNPFDYLRKIPAFNMGAYLHISALGDISHNYPKRLYHQNLPQSAVEEFEQAVAERLPPCAKSCFLNQTFSWLSDIVTSPSVPEKDRQALAGYLDVVKDGLCMPLYGPHNSNGYIFIGLNEAKSAFTPEMPYQLLSLVQLMHTRYRHIAEKRQKRTKLTPREGDVLELISLGKTNSEIGDILSISANTVSGYVSQIFLKLDVSDRVSAAMRSQAMI